MNRESDRMDRIVSLASAPGMMLGETNGHAN